MALSVIKNGKILVCSCVTAQCECVGREGEEMDVVLMSIISQ
jgi:hypothetical protein